VHRLEHRLYYLSEPQTATRVQHRRVADLHVADVLRRGVGGELVRGAIQRVGGLQHCERDVERLEILHQTAGGLADMNRARQSLEIRRRQRHVLLESEIEDGLQAHRSVEMHVQIGLG